MAVGLELIFLHLLEVFLRRTVGRHGIELLVDDGQQVGVFARVGAEVDADEGLGGGKLRHRPADTHAVGATFFLAHLLGVDHAHELAEDVEAQVVVDGVGDGGGEEDVGEGGGGGQFFGEDVALVGGTDVDSTVGELLVGAAGGQ